MKPFLIFLIDDDPIFLRVLDQQLKQTKYLRHYPREVKSFSTGETCLLHLNENPDIVILDYKLNAILPDAENGFDILNKIKSINSNISVIILSVQDNLAIADTLHEAGAEEYLIKNENSFSRINKTIKNVFDRAILLQKVKKDKFKNTVYKITILVLLLVILFLYTKI